MPTESIYHLEGNLSWRPRCLPIFAKGFGLDCGSSSTCPSSCMPEAKPGRRFSLTGLLLRIIRSAKSFCSMAASSREFRGEKGTPASLMWAAFLRGDLEWLYTPRLPP